MHHTGYELEIIHQQISEFQQQATRDRMIKEMKKAGKEKPDPSLWSLIRSSLFRFFKGSSKAPTNQLDHASFSAIKPGKSPINAKEMVNKNNIEEN